MFSLIAACLLLSLSSILSFTGKFKNSITEFSRGQTFFATDKESLIEIRNRLEDSDYPGAFQVLKRNPLIQLNTEDARSLLNNLDFLTIPTADEQSNQKESIDACTFLYKRLERQSVFRGFGCIDGEYPEKTLDITPKKLEQVTGLNIKALTPMERTTYWRLAGIGLCLAEYAIGQQLGINPLYTLIPATFVAGAVDQIFYRGAGFESFYQKLFPEYKQKIIYHEAGHFLIAYLLGIPIRGCVTNALEARKYPDIKGQAGTIFYDPKLEDELSSGKLKRKTLDRLSVVIMAGIAAEAIQFGKAEGGASDEQSLVGFLTAIQPPFSVQRVKGQAQWAAMQAILLIREHAASYKALCDALQEGSSVGNLIIAIEENLPQILPSSTRSAAQKMKLKDMESTLLMKYIQKITNRVGGIKKAEYSGNVISNMNENRDLVKVGIDGFLIQQVSVKQESAENNQWNKKVLSSSVVQGDLSISKSSDIPDNSKRSWFEEDDNFSSDFKEKVRNLEKDVKKDVNDEDVVDGVVLNKSSGSGSGIDSVSIDGSDSDSVSIGDGVSDVSDTRNSVSLDSRQSTSVSDNGSGHSNGSSSYGSVFGDGISTVDLDSDTSEGNMDYTVQDVIDAYKEVQMEKIDRKSAVEARAAMIGPIQPEYERMANSNNVLREIKEINGRSANISMEMLLSSRGYQLKKLENSKAGFEKKVEEVNVRIEELKGMLLSKEELTTIGKNRW